MIASTHKIVGSLTQSAMLLVAHSGRVDTGAVARAVRLVRSTSPSALLMASLDAARRQLAIHGEALLAGRSPPRRAPARRSSGVAGCAIVGAGFVGRPGIAGWDPLRIVIDVRGTGCTGYEVVGRAARLLRHLRRARDARHLVLVLGLGQPVERRSSASRTTSPRPSGGSPRPGALPLVARPPVAFEHETAMTPRDAFLGASEAVPVEEAVGRISCEAIAGYPPGVPSLLPGERITEEVVAYLRELTAAGARLHGAADPASDGQGRPRRVAAAGAPRLRRPQPVRGC